MKTLLLGLLGVVAGFAIAVVIRSSKCELPSPDNQAKIIELFPRQDWEQKWNKIQKALKDFAIEDKSLIYHRIYSGGTLQSDMKAWGNWKLNGCPDSGSSHTQFVAFADAEHLDDFMAAAGLKASAALTSNAPSAAETSASASPSP